MKILRLLAICGLATAIFSLIAFTSRKQTGFLLGKYQLQDGDIGVEFIEYNRAILHSAESHDSVSMEYEVIDGKDGQSIRFDGHFLEGQVARLYREGDTIILSNDGGDRRFQKVDGFSFYGEGSAVKERQQEGKMMAYNINRAQLAHFIEFGRLATEMNALGDGMFVASEDYSFSLKSISQDPNIMGVFVHAKSPGLNSYFGAVDVRDLENADHLSTIICETDSPDTSLPATVNIQDGLACPPGLSPLR